MKNDDNDLKNLLEPLKNVNPTDLDIHKWKRSIGSALEQPSKEFSFKLVMQLSAAMIVGIIIGASIFNGSNNSTSRNGMVAQLFSNSDATFEHSHANLD